MAPTQDWFEMRDLRRRRLAEAAWIPLRCARGERAGQKGTPGWQEEWVGIGSVAFPVSQRAEASAFRWDRLGSRSHRAHAFSKSFKPPDVFQDRDEVDLGHDLVLEQSFDGIESSEWHLNQDLVFALELRREGDCWVRPIEGHVEVVRLQRDVDERPVSVEIRTEYLREYLCVRAMALRVVRYHSRSAVVEELVAITWPGRSLTEGDADDLFEGRIHAIHAGTAMPYGGRTAVFHWSRTDVDEGADVPTIGPSGNDNVAARQFSVGERGRAVLRISGQWWRNDWVEPADSSPRLRDEDECPSTCSFIVDGAGRRASPDTFAGEEVGGFWLWFRPELVPALFERRGGQLEWFTRDTGRVARLYGCGIHFGLNEADLINVYAGDVGSLPEWQRQLWAAFNVAPNGRVSEELMAAQVRTQPADTVAPELRFGCALRLLDEAARKRWGQPLFRTHQDHERILGQAHRFRALAPDGLYSLAKDLARLTADSIDVGPLQKAAPVPRGEKRGSLKSLEAALATVVSNEQSRTMLGPLVGAYELRLIDAHLPTARVREALKLAGVDPARAPLRQAMQLLDATAQALEQVAAAL